MRHTIPYVFLVLTLFIGLSGWQRSTAQHARAAQIASCERGNVSRKVDDAFIYHQAQSWSIDAHFISDAAHTRRASAKSETSPGARATDLRAAARYADDAMAKQNLISKIIYKALIDCPMAIDHPSVKQPQTTTNHDGIPNG